MLTEKPPAARKSPVERLSGRTYKDYRRAFDQIISSAAEGRMTLEVLKDISSNLLRFFRCSAAELVVQEKQKTLHTKALGGHPPSCRGWREKDLHASAYIDAIESVPRELIERLKPSLASTRKKGSERQLVFMFPNAGLPGKKVPGQRLVRHVFVLIPAGKSLAGVLALSFPSARRADPASRDLLIRLGTIIGLSLDHNRSRFELRERVKELTCMYNIANLAVMSDQPLDEFFRQVVQLLPAAYLYPDITAARIVLGEKIYETAGFATAGPRQAANIVVGDLTCGTIEVACLEARPELDEGPFLIEERRLLDSVAREISIIIERKRAQTEQNKLHEQLRHAERLATIGKLAAGVAHELNEPLTGILGFAELLKEIPGMPPQGASDIGRIESAALHAREIVRKLLLFAKQIPPKKKPVDINTVVRDVLPFFENRCARKGVEVCCDLGLDLPAIFADESQIRQIVMNLVVNAIQAMADGGQLHVSTRVVDGHVALTVRDTGVGIPEEIRSKIFLPFFTTKDAEKGTGLGLSVVLGIVKSHQGRIEVTSEAGQGSEFAVYLPAFRDAHPPAL
jgi:signal transduction histidine kinase